MRVDSLTQGKLERIRLIVVKLSHMEISTNKAIEQIKQISEEEE